MSNYINSSEQLPLFFSVLAAAFVMEAFDIYKMNTQRHELTKKEQPKKKVRFELEDDETTACSESSSATAATEDATDDHSTDNGISKDSGSVKIVGHSIFLNLGKTEQTETRHEHLRLTRGVWVALHLLATLLGIVISKQLTAAEK